MKPSAVQLAPVWLAATLCAVSIAGAVDLGSGKATSGEISPVQSCFYECKQKRSPQSKYNALAVAGRTLEDSLLMLVNENLIDAFLIVQVGVFDGNQNLLLNFKSHLGQFDLDEINICRTLELAGVVPPQAGVLEVLTFDQNGVPEGGVYAWVKELALKAADEWDRSSDPDPTSYNAVGLKRKIEDSSKLNPREVEAKYHSKVVGIGGTECRVTPVEGYGSVTAIQGKLSGSPSVLPAYVQDTAEVPPVRKTCTRSGFPCATDPGLEVPCPGGSADLCQ